MNSKKVSKYQSVFMSHLTEKISGSTDKQDISILVSDDNDFGDFIHLKDAKTKQELTCLMMELLFRKISRIIWCKSR